MLPNALNPGPGSGFSPGESLIDPTNQFPSHKTGEDWWYSVTPHPASGGYVTSGYATWMYYDMNLSVVGGCKIDLASGASYERPVLAGESLSAKLATVALYNKKGEMIWCKPIISASEGAYSCKVDLDGNIVATGWSNATRDVNGNSVRYNPKISNNGEDLDALNLCSFNVNRAFVIKFDPSGNVLWRYSYSMYDIGTSGLTDAEIIGLDTRGLDILVDNDGNYVINGSQESRFSPNMSSFLLKINTDGKIIRRTEININGYNTITKSVSKDGNGYLVGGYAEETGLLGSRSHGIVLKYDSNLNPILSGGFGVNSFPSSLFDGISNTSINIGLIWIQNIDNFAGAADVNVVFDTKKLSNGNIAVTSVDDCTGCKFSGNNLGIGNLRIYNANGVIVPTINGGNPIRLNQMGDGYIKAFDIRVELEPEDPNEITIISTVKDGDITDPAKYPIFEQSMNIISNGATNDRFQFIGFNGFSGAYTPRDGSGLFFFNYAQTSALLSNYSIDGALRWEKTIDIDDAPIQVYPGDWKEQECVYQVMKGEDGEYVFVGNTSHNKDDYLIAKVHGNCHFDIVYDLKPVSPAINNIVEITANTTWNPAFWGGQTAIDVRGEIHVKAGVTLFISGMTVRFADGGQMVYDTKLIIEPGGILFLQNGSVLTSNNCPGAMWRGVEVWGNTGLAQTGVNQGTVIMNNSTISNATTAIQPWKVNSWSQTGGIIRATSATFLNNVRDVQFIAYQNLTQSGVELPNKSFFTNCNFKTNNSYKQETILPHVTLYKVRGVNFSRCNFEDERVLTNVTRKGKGIFSIDANYKVAGTPIGNNALLHEYYSETNYNVCTFKNLLSGIEAMNGNSQNSIIVDHAKFTDCRFGVKLRQVDNALVTRNKFETTPTGTSYASVYGVYLEKSTAYQVEGNIVENNKPNSGSVIGISINNGGLEDNQVYKNKLVNTHYGVYSFSKNRNDFPASSEFFKGLEFLCNTHTANKRFDQLVYGFGTNDGEKPVQGLLVNPAQNVFTPNNGIVEYNIKNLLNYDLYYIYNTLGTPNELPLLISDNVFLVGVGSSLAGCPTTFTTINPGGLTGVLVNGITRPNLVAQFDNSKSQYAIKLAQYNQLLANGDRQQLHQAVANLAPNNKQAVKNLLLASSPYLSEDILFAISNKSQGAFPNSWVRDIIGANVEIVQNSDYMSYLLTKPQPMPNGLYNQISALAGTYSQRTVKQHELIGLERDASTVANYILKDITADTLGLNFYEYNQWIAKRQDVLCQLQFADNYLQKGLKDSCQLHLAIIDQNISQLTAGELKEELIAYSDFKKLMLVATNSLGTLEEINEETATSLRSFAQNSTGTAKVQAQNILCFFLNECIEDPNLPLFDGETKSMLFDDKPPLVQQDKNSTEILIYPNPAKDFITVDLNNVASDELLIFDINGRLIATEITESKSYVVPINQLKNGVYFLHFLNKGALIDHRKIIKQ